MYTLDEVNQQFTFSSRRQWLWKELVNFMRQSLIAQASRELWIDGSFAEAKPEPRDVDVLFVQEPSGLSAAVLDEIGRFNEIPVRARLKNHHGIDFNQSAVNDGLYPELYRNWWSNHWDWEVSDPQPVPKGIILVKL